MPLLQLSIGIIPDKQYSKTEVQNWFIGTLTALRVKGGTPEDEAARYAWKSWEAFQNNLPKKEHDGQ